MKRYFYINDMKRSAVSKHEALRLLSKINSLVDDYNKYKRILSNEKISSSQYKSCIKDVYYASGEIFGVLQSAMIVGVFMQEVNDDILQWQHQYALFLNTLYDDIKKKGGVYRVNEEQRNFIQKHFQHLELVIEQHLPEKLYDIEVAVS